MNSMQWQPISTAPKDGTIILLAKISEIRANKDFGIEYKPSFVWWATQGFWSDRFNNWNDGVEPSGLAGPTHWLKLPEPPNATHADHKPENR